MKRWKKISCLKKLSVKLVSERDDVWNHWAVKSNINSLSNNRILLKEIKFGMYNRCYLNECWLNLRIQIMINQTSNVFQRGKYKLLCFAFIMKTLISTT